MAPQKRGVLVAVAVAAAVAALLAACQPSADVESLSVQKHDGQAVAADREDTTTDALTPEFLGWVAPIDRSDLEAGEAVFGVSRFQAYLDANAGCLRDQGYRALAGVLTSKPVPVPAESPFDDEGTLLINLRGIRENGFLPPSGVDIQMEAVMFLQMIGPIDPDEPVQVAAMSEVVAAEFERHFSQFEVDWGVSAEAIPDLVAVQSRCAANTDQTSVVDPNRESVRLVQSAWIDTLRGIDELPEVAAEIETAVACLRSVDPAFAEVDSLDGWSQVVGTMLAGADASSPSGFTDRFSAWGVAYADCVESVVAVRRSPRLEARDAMVQGELAVLLELQRLLVGVG